MKSGLSSNSLPDVYSLSAVAHSRPTAVLVDELDQNGAARANAA